MENRKFIVSKALWKTMIKVLGEDGFCHDDIIIGSDKVNFPTGGVAWNQEAQRFEPVKPPPLVLEKKR